VGSKPHLCHSAQLMKVAATSYRLDIKLYCLVSWVYARLLRLLMQDLCEWRTVVVT
jgi:hypothetical protein